MQANDAIGGRLPHQSDRYPCAGKAETNWFNRAELEALALAYLRLAEQADRNAKTDVVYEPPLMQQQHPPRVEQQQQQSQQQPEAQRQTSLGNDGTE